MIRIIEIFVVIVIVIQLLSCQPENILYHSCGTTASSYSLVEWNIENSNDRLAMRETVDDEGRVKKLEFLINSDYPTLCYLPKIVEYEYEPNKITEKLFSQEGEVLTANECEMYYKTVYHLSDSLITTIETFFELDTINYSQSEIKMMRSYVKPYVRYKCEESINCQIDFYKYSLAKYNGNYPTNKGYIFPTGNYYYDVEPTNHKIKDGLYQQVKLSQKEYPYQRELKNGYQLKYEIIEDSESRNHRIELIKNDRHLKILNSTSYGLPYKNLGYVTADFEESFVYVQSHGSGNPHNFKLMSKKNGETIKEGYWIDANIEREIILFYIEIAHVKSLRLYDVHKEKDIDITNLNFEDCYNPEECFSIGEITENHIIINQVYNNQILTKKYYR